MWISPKFYCTILDEYCLLLYCCNVQVYFKSFNFPGLSSPSLYLLFLHHQPFPHSSNDYSLLIIHRKFHSHGPIESDAVCKGRASPLLSPWTTLRSQGFGLKTLWSGWQKKFSSVFHSLQRMEEYVSEWFRLLSSPSCDHFLQFLWVYNEIGKVSLIDSFIIGAVFNPTGWLLKYSTLFLFGLGVHPADIFLLFPNSMFGQCLLTTRAGFHQVGRLGAARPSAQAQRREPRARKKSKKGDGQSPAACINQGNHYVIKEEGRGLWSQFHPWR